MQKENLILVHSFPTNSILLKGLVDYLEDSFIVHFIDLPGFISEKESLPKITLEGYTKFVEEEIEKLNLKSFLLAGISFGFLVVNNAKLGKQCKGILAIEPYTGSHSLTFSPLKRILYLFFLNLVCIFNLHYKIWNSRFFIEYAEKFGQPKDRLHHTFTQVDARTFFETARLIVNNDRPVVFHNLPYVLAINQEDQTVNYNYLVKYFTDNIERVLVIKIKTEHYPVNLTKEYFRKMVPEGDVQYIINFIFGKA